MKENTNEQELVCGVCNKEQVIYSYTESPLPFFFSKKLHFFEDADIINIAKGFPICNPCYTQLDNGIKFVKNRMDYRISTLQLKSKEKKLVESGISLSLPCLFGAPH